MALLNKDKKTSEDDFQSGGRPCAGKFHVGVNLCSQSASKNTQTPGIQAEFQVICEGLGVDNKQTKEQAGKTIPLFMSLMSDKGEKETENCLNQVGCFAMAVGLLQPGEQKDTDDIDWEEAIGRELVVEITARKYTDKGGNERVGSEVRFCGFWSLGNPKVKDVPRDLKSPGMQALGRGHVAGGKTPPVAGNGSTGPAAGSASTAGTAGNAGTAGSQSATGQQQTGPTASTGKGKWSGL